MPNLTGRVNLDHMECGECGIQFAIPHWYNEERRKEGVGWYCPNGHSRTYGESQASKLMKQLIDKETELWLAKLDTIDAKKKQENAEKKLRRVANGVCPQCNRSFQNLRRHMSHKHSEKAK